MSHNKSPREVIDPADFVVDAFIEISPYPFTLPSVSPLMMNLDRKM